MCSFIASVVELHSESRVEGCALRGEVASARGAGREGRGIALKPVDLQLLFLHDADLSTTEERP